MTGRTRDYLADLANRKGIVLPGFQDETQARASEEIEKLKKLPDRAFPPLADEIRQATHNGSSKIIKEINKWTFER